MELVAHDMHDPNNMKQVLEAVKGEVKAEKSQVRSCKVQIPLTQFGRLEPAYELHYYSSGPNYIPLSACGVWISQPCFRDCQIFLLRGVFLIGGRAFMDTSAQFRPSAT